LFRKTIYANGEKWDANIMNLFCFTLRNVILEWGKKFMQSHLGCTFVELETAFCKHYRTIQNDEQVYMAFRVITEGSDEKVDIYYERILKLVNCFQHKADNSLLTTFFRVGLVSFLRITTTRMKCDTLFEHKEFAINFEETIVDAEEYQKLS